MAGPYGLGDPAGMRAEATRLRSRAGRLGGLAHELERRARETEFEGPAANSFRFQIGERRRRLETLAEQLQRLAHQIEVSASRAEAEIHRRRTLEHR